MDRVDLSVISPVYNGADSVGALLGDLVDQTHPEDRYEVIVVDNDSTDATPRILEEYASDNANVRTVRETRVQTSYAARNRGIAHARADYLAFIDADMRVDEDWVASCVSVARDTDCPYVGVEVEVTPSDPSPVARYTRAVSLDNEFFTTEMDFAATAGLLVERRLFEDLGGFDDRLVSSGDYEFGLRVAEAGYDKCYTDAVTSYHPARSTVRALTSKHARIGRGEVQRHRLYPDRWDRKPVFTVSHPHPAEFIDDRERAGAESLRGMLVMFALGYTESASRAGGRLYEYLFGSEPDRSAAEARRLPDVD